MKVGRYEASTVILSHFRLDGGSMFGSVPKNLWERKIRADSENCIPMVARSLLLTGDNRRILIDSGMGEKWSEKERQIFAIKNTADSALPFKAHDITDLILTHLHFDHAGGATRADKSGTLTPTFPNAKVYLQKSNLENAKNPTVKERASYRLENYQALEGSNLSLVEGSKEILPGITTTRIDGHTIGQQLLEISDGATTLLFASDLMPTSHHIPLVYHMGYDACATTVLKEKEEFLERAVAKNAVVVFQHDPVVAAGRIVKGGPGQYALRDQVTI